MKKNVKVKDQSELDTALKAGDYPICVGAEYFELRGNSTATLCGNSTATLWENSTATLMGSSTATLRDNSTATLWENSTATLWDNSTARAARYCAIHMLSSNAKCVGGVQIVPVPAKTGKGWAENNGLRIFGKGTKSFVVVYKAVSDNFMSKRGGAYTPGTIPVDKGVSEIIEECGQGLHFCVDPSYAKEQFDNNATKFVACPVALKDIVVFDNPSYPLKCAALRCCAPIWECDKNGKKIE